jgi:hypothetical protein
MCFGRRGMEKNVIFMFVLERMTAHKAAEGTRMSG